MTDRMKLTAAQKSAAIDRVDENIALRSGAGCGKTLVLGHRFNQLLIKYRGEENPLNRFVALTFTDKAAMEMTRRVRRLLSERAAKSNSAADRRKLRSWLEELPNARISTIHSFCASLLRSWAVEAGIDPNFTICANDYVSDSMLSEAVDKAVLEAVEAGREDIAALLTKIPYGSVAEMVFTLVDRRLDWNAADYADADAILARWRRKLKDTGQEALAELKNSSRLAGKLDTIEALPCSKADDKLNIWRSERLAAARKIIASPAGATGDDFKQFSESPGNIGSPAAWGGKEEISKARNRMKEVFAELADYAQYFDTPGEPDRQSAESLAALVSLACGADAIYTADKRQRGLLDFTDLLQHANRLIFEQPDRIAAMQEQIDQLLIDECQDTNAFQVRMLLKLMFGDAEPTAADGKLFVVGDAKQSIYRFRGAQVEVFEDLCRRLGRNKQEDLDISFRTHEAGVEFVNHLFERMMPGYTPIRAFRKQSPQQPSVEIILAGPEDKEEGIAGAAHASALQAAVTARRIREMLDAGERIVWDESAGGWRAVQPRDIAILFSRRTNSLMYERELAAHGVPYYVLAGTGFFRQQEVFDMLNALRVVDNPFDDIAFCGVLRSGMFGLDDNTLMHIAETFKPPYLPAMAGSDMACVPAGPQRESLKFAVELLSSLHRRKDAVDMDELFGTLLTETGYEAVLLSQFEGKRRLGNVRKLVEMAREASAGGLALAEFIAQTDEMILYESRYEQAAVVGEQENVVRIMTIHKAKGLEFPVVFVPDLNVQRQGHRGMLLSRLDWGLTLKLDADGEDDDNDDKKKNDEKLPLSFRVAKKLEDADQMNEDIRALYVAATRHRDFLVLVGANWRTAGGRFRDGKNNYLSRIDDILGVAEAADSGRNITYGGGRFTAAVKCISPKPPSHRGGSKKKLPIQMASCGESLAAELTAAAVSAVPPPLLGPLSPHTGMVQLAVTALGDFEHCPMLYRWRYDLRVPSRMLAGEPAAAGDSLDPLTLGTLYHRCMELLDVNSPQSAETLLRLAAADTHIDDAQVLPLAGQFGDILEKFRSHPLFKELRQAKQTFCELDFVLNCGPAVLRGQIDLIFQDSAGRWHIVDYKSDRLAPADIAEHSERYRLQMLLYCLAASKYLNVPPAEARLYFLRSGLTHTFPISPETLAAAESRAAELAERLIAAGRAGDFRTISPNDACSFCPYGRLCKVNA